MGSFTSWNFCVFFRSFDRIKTVVKFLLKCWFCGVEFQVEIDQTKKDLISVFRQVIINDV